MFGWNRRKRKRKEAGADVIGGVSDLGEVAEAGCGCDLPLIALTVMAGVTLFVFAR